MVLVGNSILLFFSSLMSGLVLHFSPRIRNSVSGSPSTRQQPDMNDSLTKAVKDFSSVKGVFTWVFSKNCQSYREISLTALFLTMRYGMMVLMVSPWRPLYCTVLYCTVLYGVCGRGCCWRLGHLGTRPHLVISVRRGRGQPGRETQHYLHSTYLSSRYLVAFNKAKVSAKKQQ